jgi:hypothetical protein
MNLPARWALWIALLAVLSLQVECDQQQNGFGARVSFELFFFVDLEIKNDYISYIC